MAWVADIAQPLNAGANETGGDRFPGTSADTCETQLIAFSNSAGDTALSVSEDTAPPITTRHGDPGLIAFTCNDHGAAVAIPILEAGARTGKGTDDERAGIGIGEAGDPMFTLQREHQHAVAFTERTRSDDRAIESQEDLAYVLTNPGAGGRSQERNVVTPTMAVRRLTPRECEALQGFSEGYTAIPGAADGPRYRALGNSMAVPVIAWLGRRIIAAAFLPTPTGGMS